MESKVAHGPNEMILFLDFDGVLHPTWTPSPREGYWLPYNGPMFTSAHVLAEILRPYRDQIDIVISSTWGASRSLDALKALLPDELAERVNDAVYHQLPPLDDLARGHEIDSRYAEIAYYLTATHYTGKWLALDDDDDGWPPEQQNHLVHADRDLGSEPVQQRLRDALHEQLGHMPIGDSPGPRESAGRLNPRRSR